MQWERRWEGATGPLHKLGHVRTAGPIWLTADTEAWVEWLGARKGKQLWNIPWTQGLCMQQHTFPGSWRPRNAQLGLLCLHLRFRSLALPRRRQSEKPQEEGPNLGREEALSHMPANRELQAQQSSGNKE